MSIPAFGWALEQGRRLKLRPADRLVLLFLADQANPEGVCRSASQERIQRYTGLNRKTVQASTGRLAEAQLVDVMASAGVVTVFKILRPTPGNGTGVDPGKTHHTTPVKRTGVTPVNGTVVEFATPVNGTVGPRQTGPVTPVNETTVPFFPKEDSLKRRAGAPEASKDSKNGEGGSGPASPPPVPKAPTIGGTTESSNRLIVPKPVIQSAEVDPLDHPVDPGHVAAVLERLRHDLRMRAYPPRAAAMSPNDQIAELAGPVRPKPAYLSREQLQQIRGPVRAYAP